MQERRALVLMSLLLALLAGYLVKDRLDKGFAQTAPSAPEFKPGRGALSGLQVSRASSGLYTVKFDYDYDGPPHQAYFSVRALTGQDTDRIPLGITVQPEPGHHSVETVLRHPMTGTAHEVTRRIVATLRQGPNTLASAEIDYVIEWPDASTYAMLENNARKTKQELYDEAVALIDEGESESIESAKKNLEQIILADHDFAPAYIELARVAMKSNWSAEGLAQAEKHLLDALQIDPKSANAKVLIGYVYAHQKRYSEAEAALSEAAAIGTKNAWLWANWGEVLLLEGKAEASVEKYLRAVAGERSYDTYDRARIDAYDHLFPLLERANDEARLEQLYRKRADEFKQYTCFEAEYGAFRLRHYGDFAAGIEHARGAVDAGCKDDESREILGLAYYVAWAGQKGDERAKSLAQARVFFPEGPRLVYQLARSKKTLPVVNALEHEGVAIDGRDSDELNALAYAFMAADADAAAALAKLGAKFGTEVGRDRCPVAFIPFLQRDVKSIAMMRERGVDFTTIRYRGVSATDFARNSGDPELEKLVRQRAKVSL